MLASGSSTIGCRSGCSCRRTSTSGVRDERGGVVMRGRRARSRAASIRRPPRRSRGGKAGRSTASRVRYGQVARARDRSRAPRRGGARRRADTSSSTSICAPSAARRSPATARSRKTRDRDSPNASPVAFRRPTCRRATRFFSRSRSAGPRCSDAERIVIGVNALDYSGLSRLPARVHRRVRVPGEPGDAGPASKGGRFASGRRCST